MKCIYCDNDAICWQQERDNNCITRYVVCGVHKK